MITSSAPCWRSSSSIAPSAALRSPILPVATRPSHFGSSPTRRTTPLTVDCQSSTNAVLHDPRLDADTLTDEGVRAALEIGRRLTDGYELLVSSDAQRATQTLACFASMLREPVGGGAVVEAGLRSRVEAPDV